MKTRQGDGTEALSEEMESNGSATPKSRRHPLTLPADLLRFAPQTADAHRWATFSTRGTNMRQWLAGLDGNETDLQRLCKLMQSKTATVFMGLAGYYLKSTDLEALTSVESALKTAQALTTLIDNSASLVSNNLGRLDINEIVELLPDGSGRRYAVQDGVVSHIARIIPSFLTPVYDNSTLSPEPESDLVERALDASKQNPAVADALRFFRHGDWMNLYKVFEIIRDSDGNVDQLIRRNWITRRNLNRFTQTAQSRAAIGDAARHASKKYTPHAEHMSLDEARATILKLLVSWIAARQGT